MSLTSDFINSAKGLTRNPLGIIALFVSLIYGFACLVLSTSISNLISSVERLPLIWFIIIFPLVILGAFVFLVVKHHEKLYAPSDFRGDDSFIQTIEKGQIRDKRLKEVKLLESAPFAETTGDSLGSTEDETQEKELTEVKLEISEVNKTVEQNQEPTENELVDIYSNAEKWAANELSLKYRIPFKTNVKFATINGSLELDAYASDVNKRYVAEVKYWQTKKSIYKLKLSLQEFLATVTRMTQTFQKGKELNVIIVLVFDYLNIIDKEDLDSFIKSIYNRVSVEFYEYNELKKKYE